MKILGFDLYDWCLMYTLYLHDKGVPPKDLSEIRNHWFCSAINSPSNYVDVALRLIQAQNNDKGIRVEEMIFALKAQKEEK